MFQHILLPTDGSELSTRAVAKGVEFARFSGAKLLFFYAQPAYPVTFYGEGAMADPTAPEKFATAAQKQADEILAAARKLAEDAGVPCEVRSETTDLPYEAIIRTATELKCDLIFMASHGRRGLSALLLGSETQKVLTHSKVPVLVYR